MGSKNPTVIGAFVVGAVVLVIAGVLFFGGGKFFKEKRPYVMYFYGSVQGLNAGAPLVFRGVQVGQVARVVALYDPQADTIRIQVLVEIVRGAVQVPEQALEKFADPDKVVEHMIQSGLRASLRMQSFVTGLMYVSLDMRPDTPIKRLGLDTRYKELPTVPSETEQLLGTAQQALAELGKLPLEELFNELFGVFKRANALLDMPELKHTLQSLDDLVVAASQLLHNADGQVVPLGTKLAGAADTARTTLEVARVALLDAQKLLRNTDSQVGPLAGSAKDTLAAARSTLGQTQKSLSTLTDAASPALKQSEKALASVASLTGSTSPQLNDLSQALKALEDAARAIRILADSLQRNPEALLRGKADNRR